VATTITIAGVQRLYRLGSLEINESANTLNTFRCTIFSLDGSYRPTVGSEIIATREDASRRFGGIVDDVEEIGIGGESAGGNEFSVSAVDFNTLADRRYITAEIPAGTLKAALQVVVPYFTQYGVTLDAAQVDGPMLPALSYVQRNGFDVLVEIAALAGNYVWEIDYDKVLRVYQPGTVAAPFNIASGDGHILGDVGVRPAITDYANYIIILAGSGQKYLVDAVGTGNGVQVTWPLNYTMAAAAGYVNVGGTLVDGVLTGGTNETLGYGEPATWTYVKATNSVTRSSPPTGAIYMPYTAQFPFSVVADGGAAPADRVERAFAAEDVFDRSVAQVLATAKLAQTSASFKEITYVTAYDGLHPGQTQTVTIAAHALSGTHLITEVRTSDRAEGLRYEVKAVSGTTLPEGADAWSGTGGTNASAGSVTIINQTGGAAGTGTAGTIAKWATTTTLGNSLISEADATISVAGSLDVSTLHTPGGVIYGTGSVLAISGAGAAGTVLRSGGTGAPTWSTATYPATAALLGAYLRADGTNWITSTLTLPNAAAAFEVFYAMTTDTMGSSPNLTFTGALLALLGNATISGTIGSPDYVSQTSGWRIDNLGGADFRYVFADELHAKSFIADLEQALAGGQIIAKSVAMLSTNFTAPALGEAVTLRVRDLPSATGMAVFEAGDSVVLRSFSRSLGLLRISECIGVVSGYSGQGGGTQQWTFVRNTGETGGTMPTGTVVEKDSLVLDFGVSGNGYYEVNAIDGVYGVNSPYAQIVTWVTAPNATNRTLRTRFGNLYGVTSTLNEFGMLAGTYAGVAGRYFRASNVAFELHGIDLLLWDGAHNTVKLDHGIPSFAMGDPIPTGFMTGVGIWMGRADLAYLTGASAQARLGSLVASGGFVGVSESLDGVVASGLVGVLAVSINADRSIGISGVSAVAHRGILVSSGADISAGVSLPLFFSSVGAPTTLSASDDFTRANGSLGSNWVVDQGSWLIDTNQVRGATPDIRNYAHWSASASADQFSQTVLYNGGTNPSYGPVVRLTSAVNGYMLVVRFGAATEIKLRRADGGTLTTLVSYAEIPISGAVYRLEISGTTIRAYMNGEQLGTDTTDATYATGQPGIQGWSTAGWLDSWAGGDL
jgi:hypothetical protein